MTEILANQEQAEFREFLLENQGSIDIEKFNHPLAQQIDWNPIANFSSAFTSHYLVQTDSETFRFRTTPIAHLFWLAFIGLSVYTLLMPELMAKLVGTPLAISFAILIRQAVLVPIEFNRRTGMFIKGRLVKGKRLANIPLEQAIALQILSKKTDLRSNQSTTELNCISASGERINILCHGNKRQIQKDAETLSNFFGMLIWDVSNVDQVSHLYIDG